MMTPRSASAAVVLGEAEDFVLLALDDGSMIINSATSITGNVGYSDGVTSGTNQKVTTFNGGVYIHSGASVTTTPATFDPSLGTTTGGAADTKLDQANVDALLAATSIAGLSADYTLGAVNDGDNPVINRTGAMTVVDITDLTNKTDTFEFVGDVSGNDQFIVRVSGALDWDGGVVTLTNVLPGNVIWYFPNASNVLIGKAETVFAGTILAPTGDVDYHNPATFNGRIIALDINVHSDFNITQPPSTIIIPTPAALPAGLMMIAMGALKLRH
ncbi:hypothetical protein HED60_16305 [Planctomycetales bacterium ZRK34]|nr:hypothetical protein HED60_16305 [Planctomycetales bacterium ZRK34]